MMQVYVDALQASKTGPAQYLVQRGLADVVRLHRSAVLLNLLRSGYELKAKCVSGVLEQDWRLYADSEDHNIVVAAQILLDKLGIEDGWKTISVHTQESYDDLYRREFVNMYIDIWKGVGSKPATYQITPKDRIADPEKYQQGQEKALYILNVFANLSVKQYKQGLIHELEVRQRRGELN